MGCGPISVPLKNHMFKRMGGRMRLQFTLTQGDISLCCPHPLQNQAVQTAARSLSSASTKWGDRGVTLM